jgi:hypothetical protein
VNYLREIADSIRSEVPGALIPDESTDSLFLAYALLALAKGTDVTGEDVHDAWTAWKLMRGEEHKSMVPYRDLPEATRREDDPYVKAIRRVATKMRDTIGVTSYEETSATPNGTTNQPSGS